MVSEQGASYQKTVQSFNPQKHQEDNNQHNKAGSLVPVIDTELQSTKNTKETATSATKKQNPNW